MKKCPFCAEEIQDQAIKCRHCNEFLNEKNNSNKIANIISNNLSSLTESAKKKYKDVYGSHLETPSENKPLKIRKLSLFPKFFTFKGEKYSFEDIKHITLFASAHSTFQIPIGSTVILNIRTTKKTHSKIKISQLYHPMYPRKNRLIRNIYMLMSQASLEDRYNRYMSTVSKDGYFKYYADNLNKLIEINPTSKRVRYGKKNFKVKKGCLDIGIHRGNTRNYSSDPRQVTVYDKEKGLFKEKIKFRVYFDDDIILPLLSSFIGKNKPGLRHTTFFN